MIEWHACLPSTIKDIAARWALQLGPAFEPGGSTAWVAPAHRADGPPAVLKIMWRHFEAEHEADGLRAWDGRGAVRLLDFARVDERTDVLLLERCLPGTAAAALHEAAQDAVVAALLRRLWTSAPGRQFRPLADMCEAWADGLDAARASAVLGDTALARDGVALFRELPRDWSGPDVLLATDLHAGNVLAAEREPWLAIDPKPYVGDPTYDPLQHMLNCPRRLHADPRSFTLHIARLLDLDATRLAQWLFARCVIECVESPDLADVVHALR